MREPSSFGVPCWILDLQSCRRGHRPRRFPRRRRRQTAGFGAGSGWRRVEGGSVPIPHCGQRAHGASASGSASSAALFRLVTPKSDLRFGKSDLRSSESDVRFGKNDLRSGKSDVRFGKDDLRSGKCDLRFGKSDLRFRKSDLRFENRKTLLRLEAPRKGWRTARGGRGC